MRFIDASPFYGIHLFTHTHNPAEALRANISETGLVLLINEQ